MDHLNPTPDPTNHTPHASSHCQTANRFGPCGDPRGAGIGTPEAIKLVWSAHREVIMDEGPVPSGWKTPGAT